MQTISQLTLQAVSHSTSQTTLQPAAQTAVQPTVQPPHTGRPTARKSSTTRTSIVPICMILLCALMLSGCALLSKKQSPAAPLKPAPAPQPVHTIQGPGEISMRIDLLKQASQRRIRKVRSQSMPIGTRASIPAGEDVLRVLQYNEEILTLPKMRASRDFAVTYTVRPDGVTQEPRTITVFGYSNVTYELLASSLTDGVLLFDSMFATLQKDGTLSPTCYIPTDKPHIYKEIPLTASPANVTFSHVTRTQVLPRSERHYVIRFLGKKGMSLLFELRTLKGGSRPKIVSRTQTAVPLGTPLIEINGHTFKIHTATPEFIDMERLH